MFDSHIIEQIIHLWNMGRPGEENTLPVDMLKSIMETVFLASLKREEDRPVQVSVTLLDPTEFPEQGRPGESIVLRFTQHLPFTVDALVKIAPAFDPISTSLAVWSYSGDPSSLEIWGSIFTSTRGRNRFDSLPMPLSAPDALVIVSRKIGSLTVFRGDKIIARFNAGRFSQPTPTPFTASLMGWSLLKVIKTHPEFQKYGTKYWRTYRDLMDRLLMEASKRGHGGTIIWIPENRNTAAQRWIIPKYVLENAHEGSPLIADMCAIDLHLRQKISDEYGEEAVGTTVPVVEATLLESKRKLVEHVEILAQMTRVDCALIISDRLRPLSFGSMLAAPTWRGDTIFGPVEEESYASKHVSLSRYGTRHNSAVNFSAKCPGAVAFVISQDGPIAGLTWKDDNTVYWWPDCLSKSWLV